MKTNSNSSTGIVKKHEARLNWNNQYVSILSAPCTLFSIFLWMMVLALVASGSLTGCHKDEATPVDTVVSTPVQSQLVDMLKKLGLISSLKSTSGVESSIIAKGDLIEFGYHDDFFNKDCKLKLNEELCNKDKMVFDGTGHNIESGRLSYYRYTANSLDGAVVLKKQSTQDGKPISANSPWHNDGTFKYVPVAGGVAEYQLSDNGTFVYICKYVPKTLTSVTRTYDSGEKEDLTGVNIVQKE